LGLLFCRKTQRTKNGVLTFWISVLLLGCGNRALDNARIESEPQIKETKFWAHHSNMKMDVPYGPDPEQRMDIYVQGNYIGEPHWFQMASERKPTFIWIHGGGWRFGNKETDGWFFTHFLERGWNVVNMEHRRGLGTAPNAAEDILLAIQWISQHADQYGIDLDQLVVSGASSGGHLALLAGLVNSVPESHPYYVGDKVKFKAIINWYGISDLKKVETYLREFKPDVNYVLNWVEHREMIDDISRKYSPIHYVSKNAPPILSIHGDVDTLVPHDQAELLHNTLDSLGTTHQLLTLENGKHLGFSEEQFQLIFRTIFDFLDGNIPRPLDK